MATARRRHPMRLLVLCIALAGCGGGGRSGTGISGDVADVIAGRTSAGPNPGARAPSSAAGVASVVEGNVASVVTTARHDTRSRFDTRLAALMRALLPFPAAAARATTNLEGIRVSVEGSGLVTETDDGGLFSLRGGFSGPVAVLFERDDGVTERVPMTVPLGGTVTLRDLRLDGAAEQMPMLLRFEGIVVDKNCLARTAEIASRFAPDGLTFPVDFASAYPRSADGLPFPCAAARRGDLVQVEGSLNQGGVIEDGQLTFEAAKLESPSLPPLEAPSAAPELPALPSTP